MPYNFHFIAENTFIRHSTKSVYNLLLDSADHVIKIVERNVDIDYSVLFKNISD
jgi:hypothetical protein